MARTEIQRTIDKLDKLAGEICKMKAKYRCERCGKLGRQGGGQAILNWAHIIRRGCREIRWAKDNSFCLCVGCHWWLDNSANRGDVMDFIDEKIGREKFNDLKIRGRSTKTWFLHDLKQLADELEKAHTKEKAKLSQENYGYND